jgi:hypothetical protein
MVALHGYASDNLSRLPFHRNGQNAYWGSILYRNYLGEDFSVFYSPAHEVGLVDYTNMRIDPANNFWRNLHYNVNYNGAMWQPSFVMLDGVTRPANVSVDSGRPMPSNHLILYDAVNTYATPTLALPAPNPTGQYVPFTSGNGSLFTAWKDGRGSAINGRDLGWYRTGPTSGSWRPINDAIYNPASDTFKFRPWYDVRFPSWWNLN